MAAPHVSGIAALLRNYDSDLTADQIERLISHSEIIHFYYLEIYKSITKFSIKIL